MSIATELTNIQQDITNARNKIVEKGGSVTSGGGSSQLADDIDTIQTGSQPRLKNISPVTANGKYAVATDVIIVDKLNATGNGYFPTEILLDNGTIYNYEFKGSTLGFPSTYSASVFGADHTGGLNALRMSASGSTNMTYASYTSGKAFAQTTIKFLTLTMSSNYASNKAYINGTQYTTSNTSAVSGTQYPLDILGENNKGNHISKFYGTFEYLKILDSSNNLLYWFVPARNNNNDILLYEKVNAVKYTPVGAGFTLGSDVSDESYDGFASPIQVSVPSPTKWGATLEDIFNSSVSSTPTLHDVVIPAGEANISLQEVFRYSTIKSFTATTPFKNSSYYSNYCALADNPYLESVNILLGSSWSNTSNGWTYFASNCRGLKHASVNGLVGSASNAFGYMFYQCDNLEDVIWYFNPAQPYFYYTNQFNNTFRNCNDLNKITFSGLKRSGGSATNVFNYCFRNCIKSYDNDINHFRFPNLEYIGITTGTSNYGNFKYAFSVETSYSTYYGKCSLIFPEMYAIYNRNSTATNGHFAYCDALGKIYLPKFIADGTTGKNIFNNCAYLTEIHFGIENQATIEALAGYSSKFGATNATLYFDMPNHLTCNGVVYDRSGAEYDYDNSYYSWKNGSNVIYTTNAINPQVNDNYYTKSGSTYTIAGTIEAIA